MILPLRLLRIAATPGLLLSIALAPHAPAADWPFWRGPDYNGISRETNWTASWGPDGPRKLWSAQVGIGFSSVAVSEGRVFTMGNRNDIDMVVCLDAKTGELVWAHSYPCALDPRYYEGGPGATPTVHEGKVYTFSKKGHVFCLEAANGEVVWSRNLVSDYDLQLPEWSFAGSPLIEGGLVILNAGRSGIALDKKTGRTVWASGPEPSGYATPVPFEMNGARAVAIFGAKAVFAVAPKTGEILWEHPWSSSRDVNAADPIIFGDKVFLSSSTGSVLLQMRGRDVSVVWEQKDVMRNYFNPSVLIDGHLYGIDGTTHRPTRLTCLDFNTGETRWSQPGFGSGGLIAAGDRLIVLDKGELIIVQARPDRYEETARAQVIGGKCWTAPVLADGRIYSRNAAGDLVCVAAR